MRRSPFAVVLASVVAASSQLVPAETASCRTDPARDADTRATVAATPPGPWRQAAKLATPPVRVPGERALSEQDRPPLDLGESRRWVRGYRPATAQAQAAFDAWRKDQAALQAAARAGLTAASSISNHAANLLSGARAEFVADEPITRTVRDERYPVSTVDVREIVLAGEPEADPRETAAEPETEDGFHHQSGMTWDEYLWLKRLATDAPLTPEAQEAAAHGALAPPADGVAFDAIASNITSTPPDPILAVGPNHLIAIVNTRYRVWDKSGTGLIPDVSLNQFFTGMPHCSGVFDVFVDYDEAQDRFVMGGMALEDTEGTDAYLCLAATATNDPTGVWNRTSFRADAVATTTWIDYPHMGIGLDAIYITGNMFGDFGGFDHVRAYAVDKWALYDAAPVAVAEAGLGALFFTVQPVKLHGFYSGGWPAPGTPHHLVSHDNGGNSRVWRWGDPFQADPVIYGTVVEESFNGAPPSANEQGANANGLNDTGSPKWLDAEYRYGKLWATRAVGCNLGGGAAESCIDWIQIDVSGPAPVLEQQQTGGAYGSTGDFRYFPDLSVDRAGNLAIGYTKSSATSFTQVWVTGREAGDPAGTLQSESLQRAGLGNYYDGVGCQGGCDRWGDYTGLTVDPDGCTFWYLGQYSDGGYFNWGTHVGSFRFDSCSTDSLLQVDKGTYTCSDSMTITVSDSIAIDAAAVAAATTVSTSGGDSETLPAGAWTGSDCTGSDCATWTATLPLLGAAGASGDGTLNVDDEQSISVHYADPHPAHGERSRNAAVSCRTRLEDGGYLVEGGCEGGTATETYRDYMDGGELVAYSFGIYNPPTATRLTDLTAELVISGPAADKVTVFDPVIHIGALEPGGLTAPVFTLYIDPGIDVAGLRMTEHDFELRITSLADGFTATQSVVQRHVLQADDNIVTESECWNFESGAQGFVQANVQYQYTCGAAACGTQKNIDTVAAPWTHGSGCGSETRSDDPFITCDTAGTNAFKTNAGAAMCGTFAQTATTLTDSVLYSPVFGPAHTGLAGNGQPWSYDWSYAQWYYRSDMISFIDPALAVGFLWDPAYPGSAMPGVNEIFDYYPYFFGYFVYPDQDWDSASPWSPQLAPANSDAVAFPGLTGLADPDLQWRWAVEVYDTDFGGNPLETPATAGLALDNLSLVYRQYHAQAQAGTCAASTALVSFDQYSYFGCPADQVAIRVLDPAAAGSVQVTVRSEATGDSETFSIFGSGPRFESALAYSTAGGPQAHDGTLLVTPGDTIRATYNGATVAEAVAFIACAGGDVVSEGLAALSDSGDGDSYGDTNELVDFSIRLRNDTSQPLHNVVAIVDSADAAVDCIPKATASFGTIAAGGTAVNNLSTDPFTFKVAPTVACADPLAPPTARFRVLILADDFAGPLEPQELTLLLDLNDLPGTVTFVADFEGGTDGFVHGLGPGDDNGVAQDPNALSCAPYTDEFFWRASGGNPGGGYFCWQDPADAFPDGDYGDLNDSVLYSPQLKIGAAGTTLSFDHEYRFAWSGPYRADGARVDYRVNGGPWLKLTTLPYDGALIFNTYCNPLCNGSELAEPCFSENAGDGEQIFNQLSQDPVNWRTVSGALGGLTSGDQVQFRWRVGSMNSSVYGLSTQGGYGVDNVRATGVIQQVCDAAVRPDVGCGIVFEGFDNLVQVCGDGDALVEPTERWSIDVTLRNSTGQPAPDARADLVVSDGSRNLAGVTGNPGTFGTLAAAGGTGTATYEFVVAPDAVCVEDVLFDLQGIADDEASYGDEPGAFAIAIGGVGAQQEAQQAVDPLLVSDGTLFSAFAPAITVPTPAYGITLDYDASYTNTAPMQAESQVLDPLVAENNVVTTMLGAPFTISPDTAVSAVVDWTSLIHEKVTECTRVFVTTPSGFNWTLKALGSPPANPYNVLTMYQHPNGGAGQYRIGIEEALGGSCKQQARLSGATLTVSDPAPNGSWTANAQVALWDGSTTHVLKPYGAADAAPYDITAIYDAAGPGVYELRLDENGAGGEAAIGGATITALGLQCDAGCTGASAPAPPVADGISGAPMTLARGLAADELEITIDSATCSSDRAVVLYGVIGDYGAYQGAVGGCDIGTGPTATITVPAGNVWFNVVWVNGDGAAGSAGLDSSGARDWSAVGLCGVVADDPADAVCD